MAKQPHSLLSKLTHNFQDEVFLKRLTQVEGIVSKVLSIAMIIVILVTVIDLAIVLYRALLVTDSSGFFATKLTEIFGLFLSVLIALEILENITAYLKRHVVQVELVIVTSLTAIARKIIIFEFSKAGGLELIGLGVAILALSISYLIVRKINPQPEEAE